MTSPPRRAMSYSEMVEQLNAVSHLPEHLRASAMTPKGKMMSALAKEMGPIIGEAIKPLIERIRELESRPMPAWRGAWKQGEKYQPLSFVVDKGGLWVAQVTTTSRPGSNVEWQLCCKRGSHDG